MKKKISLLMGVVLLTALIASTAYAGVEPSPFRTDSLRLENVSFGIVSIDTTLETVLGIPPNEIRPIFIIVTLKAMSEQLRVLDSRVKDVLIRFGVPPDDGRVLEALNDVRAIANDVMVRAQRGSSILPNDQRVLNALHEVEMKAQMIINNVDSFILIGKPGYY
jgi:hypothetical protein